MSHELRPEFHGDIDSMRQSIAHLGSGVVELIPRVTDILLNQDLDGAERVIVGDDEFDAESLDTEERALKLLALQAPVAGDLRQVAAALKLAPEIERSADLCCNICKAARRIYPHDLSPALRGTIQKLSDQAQSEYRAAIEAYLAVDDARAAALPDMDDHLDELHRQFVPQIFEFHAGDQLELPVAVQLAMVARFYERLGDHAVNIADKVRYIATGWMPEHDSAARHHARLAESGGGGPGDR